MILSTVYMIRIHTVWTYHLCAFEYTYIHIYIYTYIYVHRERERENCCLVIHPHVGTHPSLPPVSLGGDENPPPAVPEVLGCVLFGWLKSLISIFVGQSTDLLSCNHGFKQCWEEFDAFCWFGMLSEIYWIHQIVATYSGAYDNQSVDSIPMFTSMFVSLFSFSSLFLLFWSPGSLNLCYTVVAQRMLNWKSFNLPPSNIICLQLDDLVGHVSQSLKANLWRCPRDYIRPRHW